MLGAAFFHMLPEAVRMGSESTIPWVVAGFLTLFFLERFFSYHHHEGQEPGSAAESPLPGASSGTAEGGLAVSGDGPAAGLSAHAHDLSHSHSHPHPVHTHSHGHSHSHSHSHASPPAGGTSTRQALSWGPAAIGLGVHSLIGGVALASAVAAKNGGEAGIGLAGWGVFIATVVHKPADALTIVSLMLRAGVPRAVAHLVNLGFSLMIPLGIVLFELGLGSTGPLEASTLTAGALAFSAGTFLCISLSDLLPELQFHSHDRLKLSLALLAGIGVMAGAWWLEGPEAAGAEAPAPPAVAPAPVR
jgi:zinc and cadmium transporter